MIHPINSYINILIRDGPVASIGQSAPLRTVRLRVRIFPGPRKFTSHASTMGGAAIGASILDQEYFDWQQGTLRRAAQAGTEIQTHATQLCITINNINFLY